MIGSSGAVTGWTRGLRQWSRTPSGVVVLAAMAVAAFRIGLCLWLGFGTRVFYDEGGDFAQAALLGRGHLLYRDVVAAHPPVSFLIYAPFTWIGPPSFAIGVCRLVSGVMGGVTAWLLGDTVRRRYGLVPGLVAIAVYAALPELAQAERSVLVEAALNLFAAASVRAWFTSDERGPVGSARWAGLFWGVAAMTKLWAAFLAPAFAVSAALRRPRARFDQLVLGATVTVVVGMAPVMLLAGGPFFEQVLGYQLTRNGSGTPVAFRASRIFGWADIAETARAWPASLIIVLGLVVLARRGRRDEMLWFALTWYGTVVAAFLASAAYHVQYNAHLGPAVALVAGAVASHALRFRAPSTGGIRVGLAAAVVVALAAGVGVTAALRNPVPDPSRRVAALVRSTEGCLWASAPGWLVVGDRLPDVERFGRVASEPVGGFLSLSSGGGGAGSPARLAAIEASGAPCWLAARGCWSSPRRWSAFRQGSRARTTR